MVGVAFICWFIETTDNMLNMICVIYLSKYDSNGRHFGIHDGDH